MLGSNFNSVQQLMLIGRSFFFLQLLLQLHVFLILFIIIFLLVWLFKHI